MQNTVILRNINYYSKKSRNRSIYEHLWYFRWFVKPGGYTLLKMTHQIMSYDQDFYAWAMRNAALIRQGRWQEIDMEHVAEELEGMGRSERNEFMSRCAVLLAHLLKWQFQPRKQSRSWRLTIEEQRLQIKQLLLENSSFYHEIEDKIAHAYTIALLQAQKQTHLAKSHFPDSCPYNLSELLDDTFYPTSLESAK